MRPLSVSTNPTPIPPSYDQVHLWVVDLDASPEQAARRLAATTVEERERASRFRLPGAGERYLAAHGALRLILAGYLARDPVSMRLSANERGKPFLEDMDSTADLRFNLSHSGALALVAVARGRQVGVDVEQLRPMPDLDGVADRICTAAERSALAALAGPHRESAFFALWTRKEAFAKATGEGIEAIARGLDLDEQDRWTLVEVTDLPGYAACVAGEGTGWQLVRRT